MAKERITIPRQVREQVLKEYSHRCARCSADHPQLHHIDENPSNNDPFNLIPLCPNCHHNWFHNPTGGVNAEILQFFRVYKNPLILKQQFQPLFKRLQFLSDVNYSADIEYLRTSAIELIRFIKHHEMGEFYASEIGSLLSYPEFSASFSLGSDGRVPQWYVDGKNNEGPQFIKQIRNSRERVNELIVEMLVYQK